MFILHVKKLVGRTIQIIAGLAGAWAALYAAVIIGEQAVTWLKTGIWPPRPISAWLSHSFNLVVPPTHWVGFDRILDSVIGLHIGAFMLVITVACEGWAFFGAAIAQSAELEMNSKRMSSC